MKHFKNIAHKYETLFPGNPDQLRFLNHLLPENVPPLWIDIGCGPGKQLEGLSDLGREVLGLDREQAVLDRLKERRPDLAERVVVGDMQHADQHLSDAIGKAGAVYCIGNTLALATEGSEMEESIEAMERLLAPGGALAIQIVNFDRVLDGDWNLLPPIKRKGDDGSDILFERRYEPSEKSGCVLFCTKLSSSDEVQENRHDIRALRRDELKNILQSVGFIELEWFGDYQGTVWSVQAPATIVRARKKAHTNAQRNTQ